MRKWNYICVRLPTGKAFNRTTNVEYSLLEFLTLLDQWNRAGADWKYYSNDAVPSVQERPEIA